MTKTMKWLRLGIVWGALMLALGISGTALAVTPEAELLPSNRAWHIHFRDGLFVEGRHGKDVIDSFQATLYENCFTGATLTPDADNPVGAAQPWLILKQNEKRCDIAFQIDENMPVGDYGATVELTYQDGSTDVVHLSLPVRSIGDTPPTVRFEGSLVLACEPGDTLTMPQAVVENDWGH